MHLRFSFDLWRPVIRVSVLLVARYRCLCGWRTVFRRLLFVNGNRNLYISHYEKPQNWVTESHSQPYEPPEWNSSLIHIVFYQCSESVLEIWCLHLGGSLSWSDKDIWVSLWTVRDFHLKTGRVVRERTTNNCHTIAYRMNPPPPQYITIVT